MNVKRVVVIIAYESTNAIAVGAAAALFLSLTALSPLVIGAVIGCSSLILKRSLYGNGLFVDSQISDQPVKGIYRASIFNITNTALAAGVGVGLAAGAGYLFPGFMLSTWSAVLAGAVIGGLAIAIAGVASVCLDKYVVDPTAEWVAELVSSNSRTV